MIRERLEDDDVLEAMCLTPVWTPVPELSQILRVIVPEPIAVLGRFCITHSRAVFSLLQASRFISCALVFI